MVEINFNENKMMKNVSYVNFSLRTVNNNKAVFAIFDCSRRRFVVALSFFKRWY